jgi:hypothetical protein
MLVFLASKAYYFLHFQNRCSASCSSDTTACIYSYKTRLLLLTVTMGQGKNCVLRKSRVSQLCLKQNIYGLHFYVYLNT